MISFRQSIPLILICVGITACNTAVVPVPSQPEITTKPTTAFATEPAASTSIPVETPIQLPVLGPAPELQNDVWINTETPLRLADLQGKVVLLEFWTFG